MVDLKKFLPKKEEEGEYFWSLLIEPGWVQAGIWKIEDKKAKVILVSPTTPWNMDEDLVTSSDTALSSAIQGFPEDLNEPSKTVFGVSASWVEKGQINEEHLDKIKKLCSELSLTPIGFVVLPEALAHYKKSTEGAPLNAVALGIYKDSLEISVFSMGNLMGTSSVSRSVSLEDDVAEGLARFATAANIPSRFLLYDGKEGELEDARQSLLRVNWEDFDKLKLLHTPKVEIIDIKNKVHAICLAGASELAEIDSLEVVDTFLDKKGTESEVESDSDNLDGSVPAYIIGNEILANKPEPEKSSGIGSGVVETETEIDNTEIDELTPEQLGFAVERDIASDIPAAGDVEKFSQKIESYHENIGPVKEGVGMTHLPVSSGRGLKEKIGKIKQKLFSLIPSIKIPKGAGFSSGKKIFILGPLFLFLIIVLGFVYWWFIPKAVVTIYLSPLRLEESATVKINVNGGSSDVSQGMLAGESASVEVSGEKTKDTTGTKTVGENAKGEVTLYRVGTEITLDSETLINGPEGLKFTLDSGITIASGSASSPGTAKVSVTADKIGAEYNLAGGASFSVANYSSSDIEAINENSFSGGSSREINAVSADDQSVLEEDLLDELSDQAKGKLTTELSNDKYFIEESVTTASTSKNFSAKEGDEASTLKLSMDVEAKVVLIDRNTLNEYASQFLNDKIPQGFVLRQEQISFDFDFEDEDDGIYDFKVRISANLLPEVDRDAIAGKIKGRYTDVAEEFLNKEVPGFVRAEIRIKPVLPGKLMTLPHVVKNIDIEFAAER